MLCFDCEEFDLRFEVCFLIFIIVLDALGSPV